ncbi:puromycin-sensitive aminopeptidase, partial [Quercus suber]
MAAANAGRINHVEPGPIDTSVLQQQANHRSEAIWNRQDPGTLTCRSRIVLGEMPPDHEYFGWFNRVTRRFIDRPGAKLTMLVSLVNRLLRHHPVGTEEHTDINDVLTAVHHIDRVQPPIPEAPNEEAASPAGPSTTEGPSTSTTPTGCPSPQPVATPPSLSTPDPSPYTPHPSPSLTISSPIPHPSPSLTIPSSIPHPFPSPVIPPPTLQEFLELSPIPSLNLGIGPTPPHMQQEPPSHNMPIGPSSAIDPPLVEPEILIKEDVALDVGKSKGRNKKDGGELLICGRPCIKFLHFQGMDLYFKRHDGQAVTCEDFFAAMRDANDADFANFLQWYSQAGTPLVKVTSSYDPKARTFSLKFCQEVPPTPGQPVKEPMFIPVALGLLDSTGKDIPLSSVYHDGTLQSVSSNDQPLYTIVLRVTKKEEEFVFSDISERPVPSLLRGYSSPIRLESDLTDSNLSFLLAHDSDEFNRLRSILGDSSLDNEFVAKTMTLPGEGEIVDMMGVADPDAVHSVCTFIRKQLAQELKAELLSTVEKNWSSEEYVFDHPNMARRALKNIAVGMFCFNSPEYTELALQEYRTATNMTDQFAALAAIGQNPGKTRDDVLADFYSKWLHEFL